MANRRLGPYAIAAALVFCVCFASVEEADRYLDLMQRRVRETGSSAAIE